MASQPGKAFAAVLVLVAVAGGGIAVGASADRTTPPTAEPTYTADEYTPLAPQPSSAPKAVDEEQDEAEPTTAAPARTNTTTTTVPAPPKPTAPAPSQSPAPTYTPPAYTPPPAPASTPPTTPPAPQPYTVVENVHLYRQSDHIQAGVTYHLYDDAKACTTGKAVSVQPGKITYGSHLGTPTGYGQVYLQYGNVVLEADVYWMPYSGTLVSVGQVSANVDVQVTCLITPS